MLRGHFVALRAIKCAKQCTKYFKKKMSYIYGPVPSRRLGISLGIDPVPPLTCTFDCIYCQLGKTKRKISHWREIDPESFPIVEKIVAELKEELERYEVIDYITASGSGEPTLNLNLGELASEIRRITNIPLALITNSSLLTYSEVLQSAKCFDLVLPSLDAGDNGTFHWVNRPAPGLDIDEIAEAIKQLVIAESGSPHLNKVWLEVMLVKSERVKTNYNPDSIGRIIEKIELIKPDEVHLNTAIRPPAEEWVEPLAQAELEELKLQMKRELPGQVIKVVSRRTSRRSKLLREDEILEEIIKLLKIRPCTTVDIADITGLNLSEVGKYLEHLLDGRQVLRKDKGRKAYYYVSAKG